MMFDQSVPPALPPDVAMMQLLFGGKPRQMPLRLGRALSPAKGTSLIHSGYCGMAALLALISIAMIAYLYGCEVSDD
jgi:hypothetical protein